MKAALSALDLTPLNGYDHEKNRVPTTTQSSSDNTGES
jgi:hypothetical protein